MSERKFVLIVDFRPVLAYPLVGLAFVVSRWGCDWVAYQQRRSSSDEWHREVLCNCKKDIPSIHEKSLIDWTL
jgi:hypothetical protein